uniref:F-box domain-containing protein n=1 Tax=Oryza glumipatula TaxID=40148 RepID=A0A0D9Z408_9ORYZ
MPPISRLDPRYHRARGLHELNRLMSLRREQRRLQIETYQFLAQCAKRKESPCQQDNSQCVKRMRYSGPDLPEDIWHHIHSLLPLQDAARAACVSQAFLRFWRCHPNLIFSWKTMGLNKVPHKKGGIVRDYNNKVDRIMKNHSGGIKTFSLELHPFSNANTYYHLNSWLEIAITSGIKELTLVLTSNEEKYNFPCSLLSNGSGDSIQSLRLVHCSFCPTVGLVSLRSLTRLHLSCVRIIDTDIEYLLSNALALERLEIKRCGEINRLTIPCLLQRLSFLGVFGCFGLQMLESKAPNLCSFHFEGKQAQFSLEEPVRLKNLKVVFPNSVCYARVELPFSMPDIETLNVISSCEISQKEKHDLTFKDPICLRQIPEHRHDKLKNVKITGFSATRSLVELICHIMENTTSLECLTLDTLCTQLRCSDGNIDVCLPLDQDVIKGVHNSLLAIRTYIEGKIPSTVKFNVREPCSRCHGWIGARYTGWLRPFIGARREQGTVVIGDRVG